MSEGRTDPGVETPAGGDHVDQHPDGVEVGGGGGHHGREQLGSHVHRRADQQLTTVVGTSGGQITHQTEVSELPVPVGVENVGRLDVTVDETTVVEMSQTSGDVGQHGQDIVRAQPVARNAIEVVGQRPLTQLGDEIGPDLSPGSRAGIDPHPDQTRVEVANEILMAQQSDLLHLADERVPLLGRGVGMQDLQGSRAETDLADILDPEDLTEAALTQDAADPPTVADQCPIGK